MTPDETSALLTVVAIAHDRAIPDGLLDVWQLALADLPFLLCRDAALELIRTSPYLPKVAEVRERARLIAAEQARAAQRRRQLDGRTEVEPMAEATGGAMIAHVLGRLKDAGQDVAQGKLLGRERADLIVADAIDEWRRKHPDGVANAHEMRACKTCFAPNEPGHRCAEAA